MGGTSEQQPANQRLPDYRRAKNTDEPATDINTAVGCWNRPLPAAAASGMIATQDVLHLLWEMEQKALHLWLPERHEPIPGYVLAWQGNPITDAQRNDRGFWSEALLADTRELGRAFTVSTGLGCRRK